MTDFHHRVLGLFESVDLTIEDLDDSCGREVAHIVVPVVGSEFKLVVLGGHLNVAPILSELGVCIPKGTELLELE